MISLRIFLNIKVHTNLRQASTSPQDIANSWAAAYLREQHHVKGKNGQKGMLSCDEKFQLAKKISSLRQRNTVDSAKSHTTGSVT